MRATILFIAFSFAGWTAASDAEGPVPSFCPFGHSDLHWGAPETVCIPRPDQLVCATCGFAFDPSLQEWEGATATTTELRSVLPDFSAVVANVPLPEGEDRASARFRQIRARGVILSDSCTYWTGDDFEEVKKRVGSYLAGLSIPVVEDSVPSGVRTYFYLYGRLADRYLRVEVMLEANRRVLVQVASLHEFAIENEYRLQKALGAEPNQPVQINAVDAPRKSRAVTAISGSPRRV